MNLIKIVAISLAVLVLLAGLYLGFIALRQNAQLASGEQYSLAVAETILGSLDTGYFTSISSSQLLANLDPRGIQLKLDSFRRVGELQSIGEVRGELVNPAWLPSGEELVARYYIAAEFATGPAEIYTEIIEEDGAWKILNFYIQSPLLVE